MHCTHGGGPRTDDGHWERNQSELVAQVQTAIHPYRGGSKQACQSDHTNTQGVIIELSNMVCGGGEVV